MRIITERLELRSVTEASLRAELDGKAALAAALDVIVPADWPPDLYDEAAIRWTLSLVRSGRPGVDRFAGYYFILTATDGAPATLVGLGGFKGPPAKGRVELGYSILAPYRRRGFAAEAVRAMTQFAFGHPEVDEVVAQTLPELIPSVGVLEKTGFGFVGPGSEEEGAILYALPRARWQATIAASAAPPGPTGSPASMPPAPPSPIRS